MSKLILIRGLPGSGKSTLAGILGNQGYVHYEADQWFIIFNKGLFDASKLKTAHQWCKDSTDHSLSYKYNVVVANTFTQQWEMQDYFEIAKKRNAELTVLIVENYHGNKSVHNVPEETMKKMKDRFEVNL